MENRPVYIFTAFMVIAFIIIVAYLSVSNPFSSMTNGQQSAQAKAGDQEAMVLYIHNCSSCHGMAGQGINGNPSLENISLSEDQIAHIIVNGRGNMPAFPRLTPEQISKLSRFVKQF